MTLSKTKEGNKCASRLMAWLSILAVLLAAMVGLDQIKERWYIFDPHVLQEVAQHNIAKYGNDTHAMITHIAEDLESKYPGHVNLKEEWVFNNAGGAMGSMWILHGSITEYVIVSILATVLYLVFEGSVSLTPCHISLRSSAPLLALRVTLVGSWRTITLSSLKASNGRITLVN